MRWMKGFIYFLYGVVLVLTYMLLYVNNPPRKSRTDSSQYIGQRVSYYSNDQPKYNPPVALTKRNKETESKIAVKYLSHDKSNTQKDGKYKTVNKKASIGGKPSLPKTVLKTKKISSTKTSTPAAKPTSKPSKTTPTPSAKFKTTPSVKTTVAPTIKTTSTPSAKTTSTPSSKIKLTPSSNKTPTPSTKTTPKPSPKTTPKPSMKTSTPSTTTRSKRPATTPSPKTTTTSSLTTIPTTATSAKPRPRNTPSAKLNGPMVPFKMSDTKSITMTPDRKWQKHLATLYTEEHFLTLFTSFKTNMEKFHLYNNTLHNWIMLKPKVVLILFSDDPTLKLYAKTVGWDLSLNIGMKLCNDTPVLRDMYRKAQNHVNSKFYAYANGDILFNNGFLSTLESLASDTELMRKPFLMTGKRNNLLLNRYGIKHIHGKKQLDEAFRLSQASYGFALDYFVVNKKFPWNIYADLVIGRPVVDNYLAYVSRTHGNNRRINVIDASATVGAIHQKTKSRRKIMSNCNKEILGKTYQKKQVTSGNVECFPFESRFKYDGGVIFFRRDSFSTKC